MQKHTGETPDIFTQEHRIIEDAQKDARKAVSVYKCAQKLAPREEKKK